jgi:hypothetical protein
MVIARNYFIINEKLYNSLFTESFDNLCMVGEQIKIIFIKGFENGTNITYLNYYSFNILLNCTKNQNTIFHTLTDDLFNELSIHKNKLIFSGQVNEEKTLFTPTKMIYLYPHKKLGIYVRKKILSKFNECGFSFILNKKQYDDNITVFTLQ